MTWREALFKTSFLIALAFIIFNTFSQQYNIIAIGLNLFVTLYFLYYLFIMLKTAHFYFYIDDPDRVESALGFIYVNGGVETLYTCAYDSKETIWYYFYYMFIAGTSLYIGNYVLLFCAIAIVSIMYAIKWQISWFLELIEYGNSLREVFEEDMEE